MALSPGGSMHPPPRAPPDAVLEPRGCWVRWRRRANIEIRFLLFPKVLNQALRIYQVSKVLLLLPSWHFFFFFWLFRAALVTYASSQTRGQMGSVAAGLQHSHSHAGSEPCLRPTPCSRQCQIPDQGARLGIEPESSWTLVRFVSTAPQQELPVLALCKRRNRFPELPRRGSSLGCFKTSL